MYCRKISVTAPTKVDCTVQLNSIICGGPNGNLEYKLIYTDAYTIVLLLVTARPDYDRTLVLYENNVINGYSYNGKPVKIKKTNRGLELAYEIEKVVPTGEVKYVPLAVGDRIELFNETDDYSLTCYIIAVTNDAIVLHEEQDCETSDAVIVLSYGSFSQSTDDDLYYINDSDIEYVTDDDQLVSLGAGEPYDVRINMDGLSGPYTVILFGGMDKLLAETEFMRLKRHPMYKAALDCDGVLTEAYVCPSSTAMAFPR